MPELRSVADVYKALGFGEPYGFAIERFIQNLTAEYHQNPPTREEMSRGTGKTTRIIAEGLVRASMGSLVAFDTEPATLRRWIRKEAQDLAVLVGVDPKNIVAVPQRGYSGPDVLIFKDEL